MFEALAKVKRKYGKSDSPWLFGTEYGTALDAHALILLARLKDVGHEKVVCPEMIAYGNAIMEGQLWQNFMQGRLTMYFPD